MITIDIWWIDPDDLLLSQVIAKKLADNLMHWVTTGIEASNALTTIGKWKKKTKCYIMIMPHSTTGVLNHIAPRSVLLFHVFNMVICFHIILFFIIQGQMLYFPRINYNNSHLKNKKLYVQQALKKTGATLVVKKPCSTIWKY